MSHCETSLPLSWILFDFPPKLGAQGGGISRSEDEPECVAPRFREKNRLREAEVTPCSHPLMGPEEKRPPILKRNKSTLKSGVAEARGPERKPFMGTVTTRFNGLRLLFSSHWEARMVGIFSVNHSCPLGLDSREKNFFVDRIFRQVFQRMRTTERMGRCLWDKRHCFWAAYPPSKGRSRGVKCPVAARGSTKRTNQTRERIRADEADVFRWTVLGNKRWSQSTEERRSSFR